MVGRLLFYLHVMTDIERRKHRRIATTWLSQAAVNRYAPTLDFEATDMIRALYSNCKRGLLHINPQVNIHRKYAGMFSLTA